MNVIWKNHLTTDRYSKVSMRSISELNQRGLNLSARKNWTSAIGTTRDEEEWTSREDPVKSRRCTRAWLFILLFPVET